MATTKSAIPSHLKNPGNGDKSEFSRDRHHGKSQSHVVSLDTFFPHSLYSTLAPKAAAA